MIQKIKFSSPFKGFIPDPQPSKHVIPQAYKEMFNFSDNDISKPTIKKCIPFLDAFTTGYILFTPVDFLLTKKDEDYQFITPPELPEDLASAFMVEKHNKYQVSDNLRYEKRTINELFKFTNTWTIKTPPGYSCLFTQPFNRNCPFKIIDGVVDTDTFELPINFPFYWTGASEQQVLLKKNTPMVQIIPFKREKWEMSVKEEPLNRGLLVKMFNDFLDNYKNKIWHKKDYS